MIKTNQILSVGLSLSIGKIWEKLWTNQQFKITWTETFVRSKKFAKWKTTLNRGTLACYENFPIKTHLKKKKHAIFFVWYCNPPSPRLSCFRSLHRLSSNNSENTNHKHLPLWLKPITVILGIPKTVHVCRMHATQVGWLSPILSYTREQSDEYWLPVKLKWGGTNVCQKL